MGNDVRKVIAENLRCLLDYARQQGLPWSTAKTLGPKAGIGHMTINRMLRGKHSVGVENLEAVAKVFGMQAWQLLLPDMSPLPTKRPVAVVTEQHRRVLAALETPPKAQEGPLHAITLAVAHQAEKESREVPEEHVARSHERGRAVVRKTAGKQPSSGAAHAKRRKTTDSGAGGR